MLHLFFVKDLKISVVYKDCLPCLKYEDLIDVLRHNVHHLKISIFKYKISIIEQPMLSDNKT